MYPVIFVLPVLNWFLFGAGGPRPKIANGFGLAPGLSFLVGVGASFSLLAGPSLWCHGWDAVSQAYLYHGSRVDAAHSFSPLWFHIHSSIVAGGVGGSATSSSHTAGGYGTGTGGSAFNFDPTDASGRTDYGTGGGGGSSVSLRVTISTTIPFLELP